MTQQSSSGEAGLEGAALPLFLPAEPMRPIAWHAGHPLLLGEFQRDVAAIVRRLPARGFMLNLCEDRYRFIAAYAAALTAGHAVLLPPSRAEQVVSEIQAARADTYRCDDETVAAALSAEREAAPVDSSAGATIPADQIAMIGFTSGSTGHPNSYPKQWRSLSSSTARTALAIREALQAAGAPSLAATTWILATVPPQHMYGLELSVMLPLLARMAVHSARPLFPADIAQALGELPRPRILVSTPVHLRAVVESPQAFPVADLIISATAPLDQPLAAAVERKLGGRLLEIFGSTETGVFASRHTASGESWWLHEGVSLQPQADGTLVDAPWFTEPVPLQDIVEMRGENRFIVSGRNTDMVEVAGKRASLADLTRRLLAIEGVRDAVVFQPDQDSVATIRRVAALVVAPGVSARRILERLAPSVDPAFMPRPLLIVDSLPRNELGKLPREPVLELWRALRR